MMKLLCISNGHGEDVIALRILTALRHHQPDIDFSALPISGEGNPYRRADIPIIGPTKVLPSGGFLNQEAAQLARDMRQGLIKLTRSQLSAIKNWSSSGDFVLAVGDIVPLIFAHRSGLPYAFVGTAKSEYWLRDEKGKLPPTQFQSKFWSRFEGWSGSVYLPWERWFMARPRCRAVFVRDAFTATPLRQLGIKAEYAGNPMMDSLEATGKLTESLQPLRNITPSSIQSPETARAVALYVNNKHRSSLPLTVALIPGSRSPEAYENWTRILAAIPSLSKTFPHRTLILLAAIAPALSLETLQTYLAADWESVQDRPYPTYKNQNVTLLLVNDAYSDCLQESQIAIATAGTATEQFVGLGKPVITLPGEGPQFTFAFATVQSKMLGSSVQMVSQPEEVGSTIARIMNDPDRLLAIYQNGKQRMGAAGAGERIAGRLGEVMDYE